MFLDRIKKFPLVGGLYNVRILRSVYHFLLAFCGALFYGFPSRKIFVIGVTGTKGKTTVLELMNSVLEVAHKKTALLSSIAVKIGDVREKNTADMTMPGRFFIQRFLEGAVRAGCEHALIEVTSEGVVQHRHRFVKWGAAFLINLHPEHIEAHGSFEKYRDAKLSFLEYAKRQGAKVFINKDDKNADFFIRALRNDAMLYSKSDAKEFSAPHLFQSDFNQENIVAAVALARSLGISDETIKIGLRNFRGVPGRMEFIQTEPFAVVVDYAHTPQSLESVYRALRKQLATGNWQLASKKNQKPETRNQKLICVLGSAGGGRDKWKRPEMGRIAATYCDAIILTDEDPYDENPQEIINQIESGFSKIQMSKSKFQIFKIIDRREAIRKAISLAKKGDIVVITGKGSEAWIHLAHGKKIPWSDSGVVRGLLEKTSPPLHQDGL